MRKRNRLALFLLWLILGLIPLVDGLLYYLSPMTDRPFMSVHEVFRPSGLIGQGLGIIGSLMIIVGVSSYSLRKRWTVMDGMWTMRSWLTFHIFLCTLGPYFILLHTTLKFGNIASISFWSMTIVVLSGIFGRYVYIRIPKSSRGISLTDNAMEHKHELLISEVNEITALGIDEVTRFVQQFKISETSGFLDALWNSVRFDLGKSRIKKMMDLYLKVRDVPRVQRDTAVPLLLSDLRLAQQRQISAPFQQLFGYWHVLHIPLALVMLVTFIIHVSAAIAFGYTWIF